MLWNSHSGTALPRLRRMVASLFSCFLLRVGSASTAGRKQRQKEKIAKACEPESQSLFHDRMNSMNSLEWVRKGLRE